MNPSKNRNRKVTVRFTEEEFQYLSKFGDNLSDVIRDVFIKTFRQKNIVINTKKDMRFIEAINRIGVNVNQITKKYNTTGGLSNLDIDKLEYFLEYLVSIIDDDLKSWFYSTKKDLVNSSLFSVWSHFLVGFTEVTLSAKTIPSSSETNLMKFNFLKNIFPYYLKAIE